MPQPEHTFQTFKSEDGTPLFGLRCHVCEKTGARYILWKNVQTAFDGVIYLTTVDVKFVLFTVDNDGELYVSLPRTIDLYQLADPIERC